MSGHRSCQHDRLWLDTNLNPKPPRTKLEKRREVPRRKGRKPQGLSCPQRTALHRSAPGSRSPFELCSCASRSYCFARRRAGAAGHVRSQVTLVTSSVGPRRPRRDTALTLARYPVSYYSMGHLYSPCRPQRRPDGRVAPDVAASSAVAISRAISATCRWWYLCHLPVPSRACSP
jgi:hypothetical protein